ncbi:hypothetical protein N0V84_002899 [Fusarium piperis]|uniref:Uncharacterized protein n=1 Tax=Fusarium piperis TaxID=1435070 RepID=A0A9W8WIH1_9HYPO|nr:hypothetical protein N0V84_002899 [Fusarium piperis]
MLSHAALHLLVATGLALGAELDFTKPSNSYIVEYKSGITKRDNIFSRDASIKVVRDFHSDIFYGANIEAEKHTAEELRELPEVANVWPNRIYEPMRSIARQSAGSSPPGSDLNPNDYDVHNSTGVWALHQKGIKGKGVKIAVVDTGVDYTHPDLGGGFGPGFKVAGGHDFAGDGNWPNGPREPDDDPMGIYQDHGTHVAGIVAGQGKNWSGVAPEATIYAYKTYARGRTEEAINIDAFLAAYEAGVDIITASVGLAGGWSDGAWEEVATRLANKGVVITVSVGNGGEGGAYRALSPSGAKGVVAVSNINTNSNRNADIAIPDYTTSWGPLLDLQLKPDVGAPGTNIYSTVFNHGWAVNSGTSMATPYLAGVAALYIGHFGGRGTQNGARFAKMMHNRLVSNVRKVNEWSWDDQTASVAQIGSGLINATSLFASKTDLMYEPMALNDTRFFSRNHKITVINTGKRPVEYSFTKEDSAGIGTVGSDLYDNIVKESDNQQWNQYSVNVTLPKKFTLQPGKSKEVTVSFQNPENSDWYKPNLPLYSGHIIVSGSNGDRLAVPFVGVGADLKQTFKKMFLAEPRLQSLDPPVQQGVNGSTPSFSFNLTAQDFPVIRAGIGWGTRQFRYDIFEKGWKERSWKWPLVPGKNKYVGSGTRWVGAGEVPKWFDDQGWNPDETNDYPLINTGRAAAMPGFDSRPYWWFGKLANGTKIARGEYVLRFAVLVPFGRPEVVDDWDAFVVPFKVTGEYKSLK